MDLITAIMRNNTKQIKQLLEIPVDPNCCEDDDNVTPLHFAAQYGGLEAVKLLVTAGVKIDSMTIEGDTPLEVARINKNTTVINFLEKLSIIRENMQ